MLKEEEDNISPLTITSRQTRSGYCYPQGRAKAKLRAEAVASLLCDTLRNERSRLFQYEQHVPALALFGPAARCTSVLNKTSEGNRWIITFHSARSNGLICLRFTVLSRLGFSCLVEYTPGTENTHTHTHTHTHARNRQTEFNRNAGATTLASPFEQHGKVLHEEIERHVATITVGGHRADTRLGLRSRHLVIVQTHVQKPARHSARHSVSINLQDTQRDILCPETCKTFSETFRID